MEDFIIVFFTILILFVVIFMVKIDIEDYRDRKRIRDFIRITSGGDKQMENEIKELFKHSEDTLTEIDPDDLFEIFKKHKKI